MIVIVLILWIGNANELRSFMIFKLYGDNLVVDLLLIYLGESFIWHSSFWVSEGSCFIFSGFIVCPDVRSSKWCDLMPKLMISLLMRTIIINCSNISPKLYSLFWLYFCRLTFVMYSYCFGKLCLKDWSHPRGSPSNNSKWG